MLYLSNYYQKIILNCIIYIHSISSWKSSCINMPCIYMMVHCNMQFLMDININSLVTLQFVSWAIATCDQVYNHIIGLQYLFQLYSTSAEGMYVTWSNSLFKDKHVWKYAENEIKFITGLWRQWTYIYSFENTHWILNLKSYISHLKHTSH